MTKLQHCVVNELESCAESTPANLVDAMFKFVRNETPCVNMTVRKSLYIECKCLFLFNWIFCFNRQVHVSKPRATLVTNCRCLLSCWPLLPP